MIDPSAAAANAPPGPGPLADPAAAALRPVQPADACRSVSCFFFLLFCIVFVRPCAVVAVAGAIVVSVICPFPSQGFVPGRSLRVLTRPDPRAGSLLRAPPWTCARSVRRSRFSVLHQDCNLGRSALREEWITEEDCRKRNSARSTC